MNSSFACFPSASKRRFLGLGNHLGRDHLCEFRTILVKPFEQGDVLGQEREPFLLLLKLSNDRIGIGGQRLQLRVEPLYFGFGVLGLLHLFEHARQFAEASVEQCLLCLVFGKRLLERNEFLAGLIECVLGRAAALASFFAIFSELLGFAFRFADAAALGDENANSRQHVAEFAEPSEVLLDGDRVPQHRFGVAELGLRGEQLLPSLVPAARFRFECHQCVNPLAHGRAAAFRFFDPHHRGGEFLIGHFANAGDLIVDSFELSLEFAPPVVGLAVQLLVALKVNDAGKHTRAARRGAVEELFGLALKQQHRRGEGFVIEADLVLDPGIELGFVRGIGYGFPGVGRT